VNPAMTKFAVVDLETTGHAPHNGDQIIEVGIVIIENGSITEEYATYINPGKAIPMFISNLTGITDDEVENAPQFNEVAQKIINLCKGAYFVAHHVQFDLVFLNETLMREGFEPIKEKVIDTVELARIMTPKASGFKLSQLAEHYAISHEHPHRALSDAIVTAKLLIKLLDKISDLPAETIKQLLLFEPKLKSNLYDMLVSYSQVKRYSLKESNQLEILYGLAIRKDDQEDKNTMHTWKQSFLSFIDDLLRKDGKLSHTLSDYEPRLSQREMAETIFGAYQKERHTLIEAETGTGKTLAYLLPSIYQAIQNDEKVLISTYTTQLQTQLLEKEIPLLQQLMENAFRAVVLKGKRHYLSLKKFNEELQQSPMDDNYDVILTKALILVWLTETKTGDVDELQLPSSGYIFWRKINAEAERIVDPKSPWFIKSFYQRARQAAQAADIVITNHALLCTDLLNNQKLLPSYNYCVIDEAHHFDKTASKHFGKQVDYVSIQYLLNELLDSNYDKEMSKLLTTAKERADELFRYLYSIVQEQMNRNTSFNDVGRLQFIFDQSDLKDSTAGHLHDMNQRLLFILKDINFTLSNQIEAIKTSDLPDRNKTEELNRRIDQVSGLIEKLGFFLSKQEDAHVKWIEIETQGAKNAVYLYCEPIEVGNLLAEHFYQKKKCVVLTSATLTMKSSFEFIIEKNGLNKDEIDVKKIESPFSYEDQVQLLVPSDLPHIKQDREEDYVTAVSYAIYELAQITHGRMLVLFTSYQMLKDTHDMLKSFSDQDDMIIIAQGISSGSRSRLKKNFQSFDRSILLGTSSFWEGVDIPGEDLSCVVIVRLPFERPNHPVFSVKAQVLKDSGKNPFMELALPNAVIRFKQGFGRLIRSSKDKGIVFVCDSRLIQSKYGKYFTDSIPRVPIVYDSVDQLLERTRDWLS
jgi:ATP-dependent DNA helicase DinG